MENKSLPSIISSNRITLKKHSIDIAKEMFDFIDQDRKRLREFLPWVDSTNTVQDEINYIEFTHKQWNTNEFFDYGIFRNSDNQYMGNIGVHNIAWNHNRCEFGYWILSNFEGKGYVSESVQILEKLCFELGFNRIEIRCSSRNLRSMNVPIRCGFKLDGRLIKDTIELGNYRDTFIFGKIKTSELNNQNATTDLQIARIHHVAIICSNYDKSKRFYTKILNFKIINETYREARNSYKLDLELPDGSQIELFSFPNPPPRVSQPEAQGLRHLAFAVLNIENSVKHLNSFQIATEPIRIDEITNKKYTFFNDPDGLPLELYEI